jgi:uncharacterized iron-regulated membrane protein
MQALPIVLRVVAAVAGGYGLSAGLAALLAATLAATGVLPRSEAVPVRDLSRHPAVGVRGAAAVEADRHRGDRHTAHVLARAAARRRPGGRGMTPEFRASMHWLHTWAGVVFSALLFAIFWTGTLSVFDAEIDRWMMPPTRLSMPAEPLSYDVWFAAHPPPSGASQWSMELPTARVPVVRIGSVAGERRASDRYDPIAGAKVARIDTLGGTGFIYPIHAHLHLTWWNLGYWIVGLAAMGMLALCVSGVIIHRRIFADFFVYRQVANPGRRVLDLHNLAGVVAFPFHVFITFSGLVVILSVVYPSVTTTLYPEYGSYQAARAAYAREEFGETYSRPPAGIAAHMRSLDELAALAARHWNGEPPSGLTLFNPGDAHAFVLMRRPYANSVTRVIEWIAIDAVTGEVLRRRPMLPVLRIQQFMSGFHLMRYRHWTLRWICFVLGLVGCGLIATGFLFWLESRRRAHQHQGIAGFRLVEGLAIGSTAGIIAATMAFFIVNRVLPADARVGGAGRAALEVWAFLLCWLVAYVHAWRRPARRAGVSSLLADCIRTRLAASRAARVARAVSGDRLVCRGGGGAECRDDRRSSVADDRRRPLGDRRDGPDAARHGRGGAACCACAA